MVEYRQGGRKHEEIKEQARDDDWTSNGTKLKRDTRLIRGKTTVGLGVAGYESTPDWRVECILISLPSGRAFLLALPTQRETAHRSHQALGAPLVHSDKLIVIHQTMEIVNGGSPFSAETLLRLWKSRFSLVDKGVKGVFGVANLQPSIATRNTAFGIDVFGKDFRQD